MTLIFMGHTGHAPGLVSPEPDAGDGRYVMPRLQNNVEARMGNAGRDLPPAGNDEIF